MSAIEQLSHFSHPQVLSIHHARTNGGKFLPVDRGKLLEKCRANKAAYGWLGVPQ